MNLKQATREWRTRRPPAGSRKAVVPPFRGQGLAGAEADGDTADLGIDGDGLAAQMGDERG